MPKRTRRIGCWVLVAILAVAGWLGWREYQRQVRLHPERFPWTPLSLDDPIGDFTAAKLAALTDNPSQCAALRLPVGLSPAQTRRSNASESHCGYGDGTAIRLDGAASFAPMLTASCPVANALWLWDRETVQPAARRHLGTDVSRYRHFGSYSCRRLYGRAEGPFSEHATADAVDVAGFVLADGRTLSVKGDWSGGSPAEQAFLRDVRDGACKLFSTTLSPDYNDAHADHFHLDMAARGAMGWTMCR